MIGPCFRAFLCLALFTGCTHAGSPAVGAEAGAASGARLDIAYRLTIADPDAHRYEVELRVRGALGDTLRLQMPVWSPGRYAKMDFARNVQGFAVTGADGAPVHWDLENGSLWRLYPAGGSELRVHFLVFANTLSGTFSVLDSAHANWNGASLFPYVDGHKPDPVRLSVVAPAGWQLMNGAADSVGQRDFTFPDYDHLIDTPTEVAPAIAVDSFRVDDRLYRVVVHHNGSERGQRARFVHDVERIVRYENTVLGPPPLERYTFLFNIGYAGGDGMEHLYSTEIIHPVPWSDSAKVLPGIGTAAHEYIHVWNVKRIRPAALGPFDYTREQYQPSLWVAEGWTQFYGEIGLLRAGIVERADYYRALGDAIRATSELPARTTVSARMASRLAPFWDGAATPMAVDRAHSFISYYTKGDALAVLLDLEIRARTHNARSLDDALRNLRAKSWDAPRASYYLQGRGYTEDDVEQAVSAAAGADMHAWFERYVGGTAELPWAETLALAGTRLVVSGDSVPHSYTVTERADATPEQMAVREGWLTGGTTARPRPASR